MVKVSVIIPSFGRPGFLKKSVYSVLKQTFVEWELIIVDDNGKGTPSQIQTAKVLAEFLADSRIRYFIQEENKGGSAARNAGWKMASGHYICFLDNDDEFYPEKLEQQYRLLDKSDYQMTVCGFDSFKKGVKVRSSPQIPNYEQYLIPFAQGLINFASGSTLMVSKSLLEKVNGYDEEFRRKQDVELMIRLLRVEKLLVDPNRLVKLNIDDRSNIPSVEDFRRFQALFQSKFRDLFTEFPHKDQDQIQQYQLIELAKVALWNKNMSLFFTQLFNRKMSVKNKIHLTFDLSRKFITYYLK